jgi:hypothetical protein
MPFPARGSFAWLSKAATSRRNFGSATRFGGFGTPPTCCDPPLLVRSQDLKKTCRTSWSTAATAAARASSCVLLTGSARRRGVARVRGVAAFHHESKSFVWWL